MAFCLTFTLLCRELCRELCRFAPALRPACLALLGCSKLGLLLAQACGDLFDKVRDKARDKDSLEQEN